MMPFSRVGLFAGALLFSPCLSLSSPVSVGSLPAPPDAVSSPGIATHVDFLHPANADGSVSTATFVWSAAPCAAAAKVKFFRLREGVPNGFFSTLTLLAERGPFDVGFVTQTVPLSPPVTLQKGDLIGVSNLTECGTATSRLEAGFSRDFAGDVEGDVVFVDKPELIVGGALELRANNPDLQAVANVIPVVISAPGQSGSFFRTRLQLRNPQGVGRIAGRLVFHPAFTPAGPSDPALPYSIGAWETQTIEDFLGALSLTGMGSVDVIPSSGLGPTIQATVYTQTPEGGSAGFSEPAVRPAETLVREGTLMGPSDPARFRLNIGIRTLDGGAAVTVLVFDAAGVVTASSSRAYPPNYFEQVPASAFLEGAALAPNTSFTFRVSGNAILYGVTADNASQSSAIRIVTTDF